MNIWSILEIEPCRDKKRIQEAYREKLTVTNPEDSEDAFKCLRTAYEKALEYADIRQDKEKEAETPLDKWMNKVRDVYTSIRKRGSTECWQELLADDICIALDTEIEARDRLLLYLSESFRLPGEIWGLLNDTFGLEEQKEELKENLPEDFLEYIFKEIKEGTLLPLELFEGDEYGEYDEYISLLNQSSREINDRELEKAEDTLEKLKMLDIYHPYQDINQIRIYLIREEYEEARKTAEELYKIYPKDREILLYMGETAFYLKDYEEAQKYYGQVLLENPKEFLARYGKANCMRRRGELKEAKELYIEVWRDSKSYVLRYELEQINNEIIEEYEEKQRAGRADADDLLELSWCYLQNDQIEKGLKLLPEIEPGRVRQFSYENLSGRLSLEAGEGEKALQHFKNWEGLIRGLGNEVPKELEKEKEHLHVPIYLQACALRLLDRTEESLQKFKESLSIKASEEALAYMGKILYDDERYEEAVEAGNELEKLNPSHTSIFASRGRALYELGYYQAAYEDFEKWIQVSRYDLEPYIFKIEILLKYKEYDRAEEIISYLESEKIESDRLTTCRARLIAAGDSKTDKNQAYELYREVLEHYEQGNSDVTKIWQVIYYMAVDDEADRPVRKVLAEVEKGLSYKKDYVPLLDYKAFLLEREGMRKEAAAVCREILKYDPDNARANMRIADIFFDEKEYEQALHYYQKYAKTEQNQRGLINIGSALIELGRLEEAEKAALEALQMDTKEPFLYHNLGLIYMYQGRYEEAIRYYEEAAARYDKSGEDGENTRTKLASCYIRLGRLEEALRVYEENRKKTRNPHYYVKMSDALRHFGNYKEALSMLDKFVDEVASERLRDIIHEKRAEIFLLQGEKKRAYKEIKKYKHQRWNMDSNLADCYILKKDYKRAREICDWWLDRQPDEPNVYRFAVTRKMWMGDKVSARILAAKGLKLLERKKVSVDFQAVYYHQKAVFQAAVGEYQEAFECIRKAQKAILCVGCKHRFCYDARLELGIVYEMMGDRQKALEIYRECTEYIRDDTELYFLIERLEGC